MEEHLGRLVVTLMMKYHTSAMKIANLELKRWLNVDQDINWQKDREFQQILLALVMGNGIISFLIVNQHVGLQLQRLRSKDHY